MELKKRLHFNKVFYDADLECELLSMLLLKNGKAIPTVSAILKVEDFYYNEHQLVYAAILDLHEKGKPITLIMLAEYLRNHDNDLEKVGYNLIMELGELGFTTAYAESYAQKVKAFSLRRQLRAHAQDAQDTTENTDRQFDNDKFIAQQLAYYERLAQDAITVKPMSIGEYFSGGDQSKFMSTVRKSQAYAKRKSGFYNLDNVTVWAPGLIVVAAPPSVGKTTFVWQLLEQFAVLGGCCIRCIFCSYEMSQHEMMTKSLARRHFLRAREQGLPFFDSTSIKIHGGDYYVNEVLPKFTDEELAEFEQAAEKDIEDKDCARKSKVQEYVDSADLLHKIMNDESLNNLDLSVLECHNQNIDELLLQLRVYCKDQPTIVCIDYLQIIPPASERMSEIDKLADVMRKLKDFQRRTNTLIFVISALNRAGYKESDLGSARGSSSIEYSADVVFNLSLNPVNDVDPASGRIIKIDKPEDLKKRTPRSIKLRCLKNRQGNDFSAFFNYYSANDYFEPCEDPNNENADQNEVAAESNPAGDTANQTDDY